MYRINFRRHSPQFFLLVGWLVVTLSPLLFSRLFLSLPLLFFLLLFFLFLPLPPSVYLSFPPSHSLSIHSLTHASNESTMPSQIEHQLQQQLESRKGRSLLRRLVVIPETSADFSSNDFLGLARNPQLGARFLKELQSFPTHTPPLGSTGSRLLDGNSRYAEELEDLIAGFHNAEAALIFNSGFDANVGFFSSVPQPGDVILYDEYIHASVHDGMKVTRAGVKKAFLHNSLEHLEELLQTVRREDQQQAGKALSGNNKFKQRNIFVAVESVYSMDGDTAPLREIVDLLEQFGAHLIVDEVKSTVMSPPFPPFPPARFVFIPLFPLLPCPAFFFLTVQFHTQSDLCFVGRSLLNQSDLSIFFYARSAQRKESHTSHSPDTHLSCIIIFILVLGPCDRSLRRPGTRTGQRTRIGEQSLCPSPHLQQSTRQQRR